MQKVLKDDGILSNPELQKYVLFISYLQKQ